MVQSYPQAFVANFLGQAPGWYKCTILLFLLLNPILLYFYGPFFTGWVLVAEFIFTLAMALKCYPLPTGGLLALEALFLGLTSPQTVFRETANNFEVILLLIFMVAGIYFMKDFLRFAFTRILVNVQSKIKISLLFCIAGAFLAAFLDAITVIAVIIAVIYSFYSVYHRFISGKDASAGVHDLASDLALKETEREELKQFRGFLRNLMMHGAAGTALGGVLTLVGQPQNLLIGNEMGWSFVTFFRHMAPVALPVFCMGLLTCFLVEKYKKFSYGVEIPGHIRSLLLETQKRMEEKQGYRSKMKLIVQALVGIWLIVVLAFHMAAVGLIGLSVIVLLTAFNGVVEENQLGHAFEEALPFTALLVVFFAIVAVIHDQHLFAPVIHYVFELKGNTQLAAYYVANGVLSAISDNVFVATVYISETKMKFIELLSAVPNIGMSGEELMARLTDVHVPRAEVLATLPPDAAPKVEQLMIQMDNIAVAINTGTNIPSVATPNGQAAFLFLLTSALAPVIRLSYGRMVYLALPYTIILSLTGLLATFFFLA